MTDMQHEAHELRLALRDIGFVPDGVTEGDMELEAETCIVEFLERIIVEAKAEALDP